ncbi:MAG TPA: tryptophan synthase subunit alpha [Acidimicrobiia bacterium]|nr:tryptophan synthase subunit alpha [Acidimicrobiia bacterium]
MIRSIFGPGRTALLPYLTAGLPNAEASPDLFAAMADAGADGFEIGIPYSDPLMDGPVIQEASSAALAAGVNLEQAVRVIENVVKRTELPALAMTYANVVFRTGPDRFCEMVAGAGAAGLIVPDMPVEEAAPVREAAAAQGLGVVLFVALTSPDERISAVAALDPAFIYGVAELGVTGERGESSGRAADLARRVKRITDIPLVLGVGISTPAQAAAAGDVADGVIVGTALVRRVLEAPSPEEAAKALHQAVSDLRSAL